jgi:Tol biopolymer transport system component
MAEVYRARDTRLQRDVAVKVVGAPLAAEGEFLRRLEQEARLAGSLNHPNIVSVHDVGMHDGSPYVVTELLQGETLRERLSKGAVPLSSALDWAVQMAEGLAAAHAHGIVHRDLKPENVFLTRSGQVKLLDFGIAKASPAVIEPRGLLEPTLSPAGAATSTGVVLGTPGYMSPEQVRAEPVDARSDVFSLGAILYELLSGQRPFRSGSAVESGYAILHEDPPPLPPSVPGAVAQLVRRCLAKDPELRLQSARDLAFSLDAMRNTSGPVATLPTGPAPARSKRWIRRMAWLGLALVLPLLGWWVGRSFGPGGGQPTIRQLTFRRGAILAARFGPDGRTVHFSAAWGGGAPQVYSTTVDSPEVRPLGLGEAQLLSVSPLGELALSLRPKFVIMFDGPRGTLARIPAMGGTPRELATDVEYADWAPDGERLAVVRVDQGRSRLEFPLGSVRFESTGWISHPRVSSSGDRIAFVDHPIAGDSAGQVVVVVPTGKPETWTESFETVMGLAWRPGRDELLVSADRPKESAGLWAVRRGSPPRLLYRTLGNLLVNDVSRDGRVLVTERDWRQEIDLFHPGDNNPTSLEWLDWAIVSGLSDDGTTVLSHESGIAAGGEIFVRNLSQPAPVKLGPGRSLDLSPDGKWALASRDDAPGRLWLLPTGPGTPRSVDVPGLERISGAGFFRDGKRLALKGRVDGSSPERLYVFEIEGAKLRVISPPFQFTFGWGVLAVSPDQQWVATSGPDGIVIAYPVQGGEPLRATELGPGYVLAGWLRDGSLLAFERYALPSPVRRFDPRSRTTSLFTTLAPADRTGVPRLIRARVTPDGRTLAFHYRRMTGALYVLDWGDSPP